MIRVLQQRIADFDLKEYEMPINQQSGIHTNLADMPLSVPLDSVKHYEDYISRLHQIPRAPARTIEVLRAGMKDKLVPVRFIAEKLGVQCELLRIAQGIMQLARGLLSVVCDPYRMMRDEEDL